MICIRKGRNTRYFEGLKEHAVMVVLQHQLELGNEVTVTRAGDGKRKVYRSLSQLSQQGTEV
jgi:hypothetical protein